MSITSEVGKTYMWARLVEMKPYHGAVMRPKVWTIWSVPPAKTSAEILEKERVWESARYSQREEREADSRDKYSAIVCSETDCSRLHGIAVADAGMKGGGGGNWGLHRASPPLRPLLLRCDIKTVNASSITVEKFRFIWRARLNFEGLRKYKTNTELTRRQKIFSGSGFLYGEKVVLVFSKIWIL